MDLSLLNVYEIIGIVVTVGTALWTYLASRSEAKDRNTAVASVLGVILTICLGIRFDILPKLQAGLAEAEKVRGDESRRQLFEKVAAAGPAGSTSTPLMERVRIARVAGLEEQFELMAQGRFIVDEAEMPLFNVEMVRSAQKTIHTTNYIGLSKWWREPWGARYEAENEAAVKRGVRIFRTFIFSTPGDTAMAQEIMNQERTVGMTVRYAVLSDLPALTGDVISIDGALVGEHHIAPGHGLSEAIFSINPEDIGRIDHTLSVVETNSRDWGR